MRANTGDNIQIAVKSEPLFKPINWLAKIAFINHLVLLNNVLMAVLAEHGGGKTSFIKLLRQELDETVRSHVFKASLPFASANLLDELGEFFYLDLNTLKTINDVIEHVNREKIKFLLVIDDAQNLSAIFLHDILTGIKRHENNEFFHICLVSDFTQMAHLSAIEANEFPELIHIIELGPLTESETATYLLQKSNLSAQVNKESLDTFYQHTGGYMARVNSQMAHFFSGKNASVPDKSPRIGSRWYTFGSALIVLSLVTVYVVQRGDFSPSTAVALENKVSVRTSEIPLPPKALARKNRLATDGDAEKRLLDNMADNAKVGFLLKAMPGSNNSVTQAAILTSSIAPVGSLQAKEAPKKPAPVKMLAQRARVVPVKGQYTIQLMASQRIDVLKQFIKTHGIWSKAKISISKRQGVSWYVLTMGEFGKLEQAQLFLDKRQGNLAQINPWIRPVRGLVDVG